MSNIEHRNIVKKKFCPGCDHFHGVKHSNVPGASGMCLKDPPRTFIVGMAPSTRSVVSGAEPEMVPILRAFYPPVGPTETCAHWTPRAEGEA